MEVLTFMYPFRAQALSALTFVMLVSSWFVYALALLQPTGLDSECTINQPTQQMGTMSYANSSQ